MAPLAMLRGRKNRREWTHTDRVLAIAFTLSKDLRCSGCGQPKHESFNPDSAGWYETKEADCEGCAELAKNAKGHEDHDPARKAWIVDTRPPDEPLRPWRPE